MAKGKDVKYRRRFYSLYLDTITVLVLSLLLMLVVWLSLRPTPVLEARQKGKSVAALSKEERANQKDKFIVRYISAPELTAANNPELIAFGSIEEQGTRNAELYYSAYEIGSSLVAPRQELSVPKISSSTSYSSETQNGLLKIEKPKLSLGHTLNTVLMSNNVDLIDLPGNDIPHIYWTLPSTISKNNMPDIEPIMRKFGWMSGSLDMILTIGNEGFVTNVIICSEDAVDTKLVRELKSKLLALHLGKQNANTALTIGVSWNLP